MNAKPLKLSEQPGVPFPRSQVPHEDGVLFIIGMITDGLASIKSSPASALSSTKSATCTYYPAALQFAVYVYRWRRQTLMLMSVASKTLAT